MENNHYSFCKPGIHHEEINEKAYMENIYLDFDDCPKV
jgi:hypothetical protein